MSARIRPNMEEGHQSNPRLLIPNRFLGRFGLARKEPPNGEVRNRPSKMSTLWISVSILAVLAFPSVILETVAFGGNEKAPTSEHTASIPVAITAGSPFTTNVYHWSQGDPLGPAGDRLCAEYNALLQKIPVKTRAECTPICGPSDPNVIYGSEVEVAAAVDPQDPRHIVAVYQQDRATGPGARAIMFASTRDGGATWSLSQVPGVVPCRADGPDLTAPCQLAASDQWVSIAPDGRIHVQIACVNWGRNSIALTYTDDEREWAPVQLIGTGPWEGKGTDSGMILADPFDSRFVYAAWDSMFDGLLLKEQSQSGLISFARSTDRGASWEREQVISEVPPYGGVCGKDSASVGTPQLRILPDGTLVAIYTFVRQVGTEKRIELSLARSEDRGETWQEIHTGIYVAPVVTKTPDGRFHIRGADCAPTVAVDERTGAIYVVYQQRRTEGGHSGIALTYSKDGGFTWSAPMIASQTPPNTHAVAASVAVAPDGAVAVSYYDLRNDDEGPGVSTDRWAVIANTHRGQRGETAELAEALAWDAELRLTPESFDLEQAPLTGIGLMLGEYNALWWTGQGNEFATLFTMPHPTPSGRDPASLFFVRFE